MSHVDSELLSMSRVLDGLQRAREALNDALTPLDEHDLSVESRVTAYLARRLTHDCDHDHVRDRMAEALHVVFWDVFNDRK